MSPRRASDFGFRIEDMIGSDAKRRDGASIGLCIVLIAAFTAGCFCSAQLPPQPAYTIDVAPLLVGGTTGSGSLAFLSDHVLAIGFCLKTACSIEAFDLSGSWPHSLSGIRIVDRYRQIKRARDGGLLLTGITREGVRACLHFDPNLRTPKGTSETRAELEQCEEPPAGSGRLVAMSDNAAAFLEHRFIRIQNMRGEILGKFRVNIPDNEVPTVHLLGDDRILIQRGGRPEIRDYNGRIVRELAKPDNGHGRYVAASADGMRLLYDVLTRHVSSAETVKEDLLLLPTAGMEADDFVPNGELVRVIEAGSGDKCFEWRPSIDLPIQLFEHSAIDPSGHLVAIIPSRVVNIFKLPDGCDRIE
jgi:hypothetical protein